MFAERSWNTMKKFESTGTLSCAIPRRINFALNERRVIRKFSAVGFCVRTILKKKSEAWNKNIIRRWIPRIPLRSCREIIVYVSPINEIWREKIGKMISKYLSVFRENVRNDTQYWGIIGNMKIDRVFHFVNNCGYEFNFVDSNKFLYRGKRTHNLFSCEKRNARKTALALYILLVADISHNEEYIRSYVIFERMKEAHLENAYKTLGNTYILARASGLMKRLSVCFTSSYSTRFYEHKKSSERKHCEQMFFLVLLLLNIVNSDDPPRFIVTTAINVKLINDMNGFLRAVYILEKNKRLKNYWNHTKTSYFFIQDSKQLNWQSYINISLRSVTQF